MQSTIASSMLRPLRPTAISPIGLLPVATLAARRLSSAAVLNVGSQPNASAQGGAGVGPGGAPGSKGFLSSLLHGSAEAKEQSETQVLQHSRLIGRNKYVHELVTHRVQPSQLAAYKKAAEKYFTGIAADPDLKVKLTGSWETLIGEGDTFVHILEYENYGGYDRAAALMLKHSTLPAILHDTILPTLRSRSSQLMSEFAFWPSSPPRENGGVFELRSYDLVPGTLLEWENAWKRGLEARKRFVEPAGAWFAQVGQLHQVHHLWQYPDLADRKATREQAWNVGSWSSTVQETVKLAKDMRCSILVSSASMCQNESHSSILTLLGSIDPLLLVTTEVASSS